MHSHGYDHSHHHHSHAHANISKAFWINFVFALIELAGGFFAQSFSVFSNALHDLGDSLALFLSAVLEKKSQRKSDGLFSYGYRRYSIAAAFFTSVILVSGSLLVVFYGFLHLFEPVDPKPLPMMVLAGIGIGVNAYSLMGLRKGQSHNEKVLSWHFLEDTLSWVLVLVTGVLIQWTHWPFLDAGLGIILALWILWNVQKNLRELINIFLQASPKDLSSDQLRRTLTGISGVRNAHHIHLWSLDGQSHIMTAHITLAQDFDSGRIPGLKAEIKALLKNKYAITEATLEIETYGEDCQDPVHD